MLNPENSPSPDQDRPAVPQNLTPQPQNKEDFSKADLSDYSLDPAPCEPPEFMKDKAPSERSWLRDFSAKALTAVALTPTFTAATAFFGSHDAQAAVQNIQPAPVAPAVAPLAPQAGNNLAREKALVGYAEESWRTLKTAIDARKDLREIPNADSLWNNIQAVLHVTDNTGVTQMDKLRLEIIERGASNPQIPARIVHGALYTMAVSGQQANAEYEANRTRILALSGRLDELTKQADALTKLKTDVPADLQKQRQDLEKQIGGLNDAQKAIDTRKEQMSNAAIPYLGKMVLDTTTKEGRRERHLLAPADLEAVAQRYPIIDFYAAKDFNRLASYVIGQVAEKGTLEKAAQEIVTSGSNLDRRNALMDIFLYARPGTAMPAALTEQSRVWVFGKDQLAEHKKAMESKNKTGTAAPTTPAITPAPGTIVVIGQPTTPGTTVPSIPGVPSGVKAGSFEVLQQIDSKFVSPRMNFQFGKDAQTQQFVANNILFLAKNGDQLAGVAAAQWFAQKHPGEAMKRGTPADATVLQALSIVAQKDAKAFEVLKRVGASYPGLVLGDVMLIGSATDQNTPYARASTDMTKALRANPESSGKWLISIAERKAEMIWPEPTSEEDLRIVNGTRDQAKMIALRTMALMDYGSGQFSETFRNIVRNPFAQENDLAAGMIGVALSKDRSSIDLLMARAADKTLNPQLRSLALEAALFIDTPDPIPGEILKKAAENSPYSPAAKIHYFIPVSDRTGGAQAEKALEKLVSKEIFNPFHTRFETNFNNWLTQENGLRTLTATRGGEPGAVSDVEKLGMMLTLMRREFGGNTSVLAERGRDPEFKAKYLDPMLSYLEQGKEKNSQIDLSLAAPMMMVLGKAQHTGASKVFANMAAYPELYVHNNALEGFMGMRTNSMNAAVLKLTALENLGGAVDLSKADDPGAAVLHRVSRKNTSRIYRDGALVGLRALAERYEEALKKAPAGPERDAILTAQAHHAKECVGHLQYHRQLLESPGQTRLTQMWDEFKMAKVADRFGGTKELLALADQAIGSDLKGFVAGADRKQETDSRPLLVRSVMHAIGSNGRQLDELKGLGFDADTTARLQAMYTYVNNQEYWLGKTADRKYTGKGTEVAVFDVGYVLPLEITKGMGKQIVYPENLVNWNDLARSEDVHPTMVAWTIHQAAKDAKIRTYNVSARLREVEFRPAETQDPIFRAFEDLAELQLAGKADVDVANYSFGFPNIVLNDAKARAEFVDQMSAFMEVLSRMDVKHAIAAANSHGAFPPQARFAGLGEVNNLGLRFSRNNNGMSQPDGVFIAAAHDAYTGRMAEFSSKLDELRPEEAVKMRSFQGVNSMLPDIEDGKWVMIPGNGTSFASPNQAAMLLWGAEAVRGAGVDPLTHKQWQEIFDRSIQPLMGRERIEGGDIFSVPRFIEELRKVTK